MRLCAVLLVPLALSAARPAAVGSSPREIAQRAVQNYIKGQTVSLRYEYVENDDIKGKGIEISRVTTIGGTPYERLIQKKGKPLSDNEEKREDKKFQKAQLTRENELKRQHDERVRKWKEQSAFLTEAPDAFDFKLLPEETVGGRPAYVLACTPKAGFQPTLDRSKMFTQIEAKAWVDKEDVQIVKIEAETLEPVSIGWVLARIGKGAHMELEQMRLADGNWVLKKLSIEGRAKVLLVDNHQLDETVTYSDYRVAPNTKR